MEIVDFFSFFFSFFFFLGGGEGNLFLTFKGFCQGKKFFFLHFFLVCFCNKQCKFYENSLHIHAPSIKCIGSHFS